MAWAWSHTVEACANVAANIHDLPRDKVVEIATEWRMHDTGADDTDISAWDSAKLLTEQGDTDQLRQYIEEGTFDLRTCDNGGWNAWVCPYGCHTVPFDR